MADQMEQNLTALEFFKDWSNYLLVTTVAALGWSSTHYTPSFLKLACIWCFAASIIFGIITLSLIPLVAEQLQQDTKSIYNVKASFHPFWRWGKCGVYLKAVCFPQHVLFLAGIILYVLGI